MLEKKPFLDYYTSQELDTFEKNKKKRRKRSLLPHNAVSSIQRGVIDDHGSTSKEQPQATVKYNSTASKKELAPSTERRSELNDDLEFDIIKAPITDNEPRPMKKFKFGKSIQKKDISTVVSEQIAEILKKKKSEEKDTEWGSETSCITMNSTNEFCQSLGEISTHGNSRNQEQEVVQLLDLDRNNIVECSKTPMRSFRKNIAIGNPPVETNEHDHEPILEEEPDASYGIAGTLILAAKKGYLAGNNPKKKSTDLSNIRTQAPVIEEKAYNEERIGETNRSRGLINDFEEKVGYHPKVELEYIDDSGRLLSSKEAFRYLSHKFHGKAPSKNKMEKRLKKVQRDMMLRKE